jgi:hypothetical protein
MRHWRTRTLALLVQKNSREMQHRNSETFSSQHRRALLHQGSCHFLHTNPAEYRQACSPCHPLRGIPSLLQQTALSPPSKRNSLNLNRHALRQLLDRNARARRLMSEVLFVNRVHLRKVVHGGNKDVDLWKKIVSNQCSQSRFFLALTSGAHVPSQCARYHYQRLRGYS